MLVIYNGKDSLKMPSGTTKTPEQLKENEFYKKMFESTYVINVDDEGIFRSMQPLGDLKSAYNVTISDPDAALAECLRIKAEQEAKAEAVGEANLAISGFVEGFAGNQEHDPDNPTNYNALGAKSSLAMSFALQNANLTDSQAVFCASEFPEWHVEVDYSVNQIARYNGNLYRCTDNHRSTAGNTPDTDTNHWRAIDMGTNGIEAWTQPEGAHDAYNVGDVVTHNGATWECKVNGNTAEPVDDVSYWTKIEA